MTEGVPPLDDLDDKRRREEDGEEKGARRGCEKVRDIGIRSEREGDR